MRTDTRKIQLLITSYHCDVVFVFVEFVEGLVELNGNVWARLDFLRALIRTAVGLILQLLSLKIKEAIVYKIQCDGRRPCFLTCSVQSCQLNMATRRPYLAAVLQNGWAPFHQYVSWVEFLSARLKNFLVFRLNITSPMMLCPSGYWPKC